MKMLIDAVYGASRYRCAQYNVVKLRCSASAPRLRVETLQSDLIRFEVDAIDGGKKISIDVAKGNYAQTAIRRKARWFERPLPVVSEAYERLRSV